MSNFAFVLDDSRRILDPCHPAVARKLMTQNKAAQFKRYPEVIILDKEVAQANPQPLTLKIDPGSKVTGFALLDPKAKVIWAAELTHRGQQIQKALLSRHQIRRSRRSRHTRYRRPGYRNRGWAKGWLPPSLLHRVLTIETWVKRICRYANVTQVVMELVRFDTQKLQNPEISGVEYQQGTLSGTEVREYLLAKWQRRCAYCNVQNVPLQVEHIHPKSKGGSDRVSNLALACQPCNLAKGNRDIQVFLANKPDVLSQVLARAKTRLKDAAAVNATRWKLFEVLKATGLLVNTGTGGQTKFNRTSAGLPKTHWLDAACVGETPQLSVLVKQPLLISAKGHGNRQMCGTNKHGFPIRHRSRIKIHFGFRTGDMVKAIVTRG